MKKEKLRKCLNEEKVRAVTCKSSQAVWREGADVLRPLSFWHDAEYCASIQDVLMGVNCLSQCMAALLRASNN
jgi:hypothetical protein